MSGVNRFVQAGLILAATCLALTGCTGTPRATASAPPTPTPTRTPTPSPPPTPTPSPAPLVPRFEHVVVAVFENHGYDQVIGAAAAPYLNGLAARRALLTD